MIRITLEMEKLLPTIKCSLWSLLRTIVNGDKSLVQVMFLFPDVTTQLVLFQLTRCLCLEEAIPQTFVSMTPTSWKQILSSGASLLTRLVEENLKMLNLKLVHLNLVMDILLPSMREKSTSLVDTVVSTIRGLHSMIYMCLKLRILNGLNLNLREIHLIQEEDTLLQWWLISLKWCSSEVGVSLLNTQISWFTISRRMSGLTLKLLMKFLNGIFQVWWLHLFLLGNTSFSEVVLVHSKKVVTEQTPGMWMIHLSWTLIHLAGAQSILTLKILQKFKPDPKQEKALLSSMMQESQESLFSEAGQTIGLMIFGHLMSQQSQDLLMLFSTSSLL